MDLLRITTIVVDVAFGLTTVRNCAHGCDSDSRSATKDVDSDDDDDDGVSGTSVDADYAPNCASSDSG